MRQFDPTDQDYNLWLFLAQVRSVMLKSRQAELSRYGITASEASVLFIINAIPGDVTPAEISRWLFRQSQSIAGILNRMERQGLVRRIRDLDKANQVRVVLTEKGIECYRHAAKRESIHRIMGSLSGEMRQQLEACLEKLKDKSLAYLGEQYELPFPH